MNRLETPVTATVRQFLIPLSSGGLAVVPVPMSAADFKQITDTLEMWKVALVQEPIGEEGEPERT